MYNMNMENNIVDNDDNTMDNTMIYKNMDNYNNYNMDRNSIY